MLYTTFGGTGVTVSRLGFGGMRFKDQKDVDACAGLVAACRDAGITYFDTAPGYGDAERLMGIAFAEMQKTRADKPFYVATKSMGANESAVRADLEESLRRLNVPHIDFFHMWCVTNLDDFRRREKNGVLAALDKVKSEGLVKHVCVSTHVDGADVGTILAAYPFEGVLMGYSAMNFAYRDQGLTDAAAAGKGVAIMNPLGGGLIPRNPERFQFVRTQPGETVVEGALRFLFNDKRISVVLVGMSETAHLREALAAVDGFRPLSDAQVDNIRAGVSDALNAICTGCGYCDACPEELPIPKLMDAYNQFMLTGDRTAIAKRLAYHWNLLPDAHRIGSCIECGACEAACTQKLPILKRLKETEKEIVAFLERKAAKKAKK